MKTEHTHTPGPWVASNGGPYVKAQGTDPNGSCGDSVVCITSNTFNQVRFAAGVGSLEDKANALLIAAAPELLAALEYIVGWEAGPNWDANDARNMALAAIAKATGGSR
jgi:hypothetical protein